MKASLPGPALPVTLAAQFPAHVAEADAGRGGEAWRARAGVRPMLGLSAMLLGPLASLPLPRLSALPGLPGGPPTPPAVPDGAALCLVSPAPTDRPVLVLASRSPVAHIHVLSLKDGAIWGY